jgi:hypothetical protein
MKVDLKGMFANILSDVRPAMRDYHGFCLDELLKHLQETIRGEHTLQEFAEHYCLAAPAPAPPAPASVGE